MSGTNKSISGNEKKQKKLKLEDSTLKQQSNVFELSPKILSPKAVKNFQGISDKEKKDKILQNFMDYEDQKKRVNMFNTDYTKVGVAPKDITQLDLLLATNESQLISRQDTIDEDEDGLNMLKATPQFTNNMKGASNIKKSNDQPSIQKSVKKVVMVRRATKSYGNEGKNRKLEGIDQENNTDGHNPNKIDKHLSMQSIEEEMKSMNVSGGMAMSDFNIAQKMKDQYQDLREVYINNYGVQMEVPSFNFVDGKLVPNQEDYVVTTAFHIIPKKQMFQNNVQTTYYDGRVEENCFDEIFENSGENIILTLNKTDGRNGFKKVHSVVLKGVKKTLIQFSKSGIFFAIYNKDDFVLSVYDSKNISTCFEKIEQKEPILQINLKELQFEAIRIVFDMRDNYLAIASENQILIYSLLQLNFGNEVKNFTLDNDQYTSILDIVLDSKVHDFSTNLTQEKESQTESPRFFFPFRCMIACKVNFITNVQIFDINTPQEVKFISYVHNLEKIKVDISDDMKTAFLSVGQENYILKGNQQSNFPWVKDKFVRESINVNNGYYLMLTKDYDRDIDILHTENHQYEASLKRSIEPGIFRVFDTLVNKRNEIKTLTRLGNRIYLDTIELDDGIITERNHAVDTIVEAADHAAGFNWPYYSFVTKDNFIFILNAFNKSFIQRYELPSHVTFVSHTFLSDTHDFYCICETSEQKFEYYNIDLDSADPQIVGPYLSYPFAMVDNKQITGFHVRGSSRKEKINLNKQNMCFMLHDDILMGWNGTSQVQQISTVASNMYYLSDDKVFYMNTHECVYGEDTIEHSEIMLIECLFGSFKSSKVYQDNDQRAEILNFGVDNTRERLIILSGIKNQKKRRDKFITLYDIKTETILHSMKIQSREIIGRLKTNLYNFVEGHIYYNNKVIKIRYDLIDKNEGDIKENELFDHYDNIVKLRHRHDFIASGTPLQTCVYNRLAYVIKNKKQYKPDRILILPYLHERRIYLNRRHESNQFYTICNRNKEKYILCLCINDDKLYVYTETGILKNRIKYNEIADHFGKPESISENGSYLLFTKSRSSEYISLVFMNTDGLKVESTINYPEKLKMYLDKILQQNNKVTDEIKFFWKNYLGELKNLKQVKAIFTLNDSGDILIRVKPKTNYAMKKRVQLEDLQAFDDGDDDIKKYDTIHHCSLFFYIPSKKSVSKGKKEYVYFDSKTDELYDIQGVSMNEQYIFFWNLGFVWSLSLMTQKMKKLSLYISEEEKQTFVKRVRCGTNMNVVAIRITQSPLKDCVMQWDLEKDKELSCYDIESNAITFQDQEGNTFILENDWIVSCRSGCKLKCYNVKNSDFEDSKFGFQYGHRMENNTHNWVIFRNFINLSFSYMTFVIKENFDQNSYSMQDYLFDIEGYDYVLNRNTIFTQGILVQHEYEKLSFILQNYLKLDPILLEALHYQNKDKQIALHLALSAKNNQMVSLILHYMSKIEFAAVHLIKDIFKDLINVQNFIEYLQAIPFQTKQMQNKQTLMLNLTREQTKEMDILVCTPSRCQYVDDVYFKDTMKESCDVKDSLTFAVKIKSIQADWIINEEEGLDFLQELIKQNNKEVFETEYIEIIIDFLYTKFSSKIKTKIMPLFFCNFVSVYLMIFLAEKERKNMTHDESYETQHFWHTIVTWLCFLFSLINFAILTLQTYNVGILIQYRRGWAWIDLFIFMLTFIIWGLSFATGEVVVLQRILEALLLVFITLKSLYFLRLIGEIAPLIDIIFVIVNDIKYFMLIYMIGLLCFIMAFYIIGQNQEYLETDEDADPPPYATISGAFDHVYLSSLGEFDSGSYWGNDMTPILLFLFICMSFFMCIHLLNMLIAIMSESFANNNLHKESKREHSQLSFVVENWWLDSIDPIKDKDQIVHLIAAIPLDLTNFGHDEEMQKFNALHERMNKLQMNQANMSQELRSKTDELFKMQNAILNEIKQLRADQ